MTEDRAELLEPMTALVQYRRKDDGSGDYDPWHPMAAFDVRGPAEKYAAECATANKPWEYRVIDLPALSE